jgi:anaerobic selenocysteine-containing dehydrogenase
MQTLTHYRTCNLCEAMCGLKITVTDNTVTKIEGDKEDEFSRGHICPKAYGLKDIYEDKDRLKKPLRKTESGEWEEVSWESAYQTIVSKIKETQANFGDDAIGVYQGNPSIHNLGTMLYGPGFFKTLRTKNNYSATSTDQLPHHFASWLMFGHPLLIPIPDIDRTDFMLIIGGNPLASNGSMMSVPDVANRLRDIQKRGGKFVVIDPRKTETAVKADRHLFVRPGTDVYLLLSFIHILFSTDKVNLKMTDSYTVGVDKLRELTADYTPRKVADITGVSEDDIYELVGEFTNAKSAVCYGRVGVSTQSFGGVCQWLINAINVLTGNCDAEGGAMFTLPAVDFVGHAKPKNRHNRWQSRVRKFPEFISELPVACLAEEILTEGEGQIKMMFTSCGNPVLSTPNGGQLNKAFEQLDFYVAFDIYLNETTRHADIILPPATGLENSHYDMTFHNLAVRNTTKYSPQLFEKSEGAKYDWEIYQELNCLLSGGDLEGFIPEKPEEKLKMGMKFGPYGLDFEEVKNAVHGIDLGAMKSQFPKRLVSENKEIDLSPDLLVNDLQRVRDSFDDLTKKTDSFLLIGRRHLRDNNSWMHNSEQLMKGRNRCTLQMNPDDAAILQLIDKQSINVKSRVGEVELPLEVTNNMMPGVVCMPHGYGHGKKGVQLGVANKHAGVSINDLTDDLVIDELTGNAAFSNVKVTVKAA